MVDVKHHVYLLPALSRKDGEAELRRAEPPGELERARGVGWGGGGGGGR